jgi:hypothetical protein
MDKTNQLDNQIQSALHQKAKTIQVPSDLFARINKRIMDGSNINKQSKLNLCSAWRVTTITTIVIVVIGMMLMTFSKDARVMAVQAVDFVKKIFVVEKVGGKYQTVVKPMKEFQLSQGLCKKLYGVDDFSLGKKVGYKVSYPERLAGYQLDFKGIGVKLDEKLDVDTFSQLRGRIEKAFEDDKALESLKVYDAHRYSGACYHKGNNIIGIYVMSRTYKIIHNIRERVTFRGSKGFWLEHPRHQYFKDKQKEAENLQVRHSLYWVKNGRGFYLRPEGEPDLTYNEALRIAIRFSENY